VKQSNDLEICPRSLTVVSPESCRVAMYVKCSEEILEWWGYHMMKKSWSYRSNHVDTVHECDRQTDRIMITDTVQRRASHGKNGEIIKQKTPFITSLLCKVIHNCLKQIEVLTAVEKIDIRQWQIFITCVIRAIGWLLVGQRFVTTWVTKQQLNDWRYNKTSILQTYNKQKPCCRQETMWSHVNLDM